MSFRCNVCPITRGVYLHCITEILKALGTRNDGIEKEVSTKLYTLSVEAQQTLLELAQRTTPLSEELPRHLFTFLLASCAYLLTDEKLHSPLALGLLVWKHLPRTDAISEHVVQAIRDGLLTTEEEKELAADAFSLASTEELSVRRFTINSRSLITGHAYSIYRVTMYCVVWWKYMRTNSLKFQKSVFKLSSLQQ